MYKVVIVEDEELVRRGIVLAIDWGGMNCAVVGEAENGTKGLELIGRLRPDIVVTDVKMPQMDGVKMLEHLKKEGVFVEAVILSAHSEFSYAQSAVRLGVVEYVLKPFADGELEAAIEKAKLRLVQKRAAQAEPPRFRLAEKKGDKSKYVKLALEYIAQNYQTPDIGIAGVAEQLTISEGYLSRVFKKETDYTFNAYLTNFRIHKAMEMLRDFRLKVYEVADAVGYQDTTYFSTLFKKMTGLSPSDYQASCQ